VTSCAAACAHQRAANVRGPDRNTVRALISVMDDADHE